MSVCFNMQNTENVSFGVEEEMSAIDAMPARCVASSWRSIRHVSSNRQGGVSGERLPVSIPWCRAATNSWKFRPTKSKAAIREFQWSSSVEGMVGILGMRNDENVLQVCFMRKLLKIPCHRFGLNTWKKKGSLWMIEQSGRKPFVLAISVTILKRKVIECHCKAGYYRRGMGWRCGAIPEELHPQDHRTSPCYRTEEEKHRCYSRLRGRSCVMTP